MGRAGTGKADGITHSEKPAARSLRSELRNRPHQRLRNRVRCLIEADELKTPRDRRRNVVVVSALAGVIVLTGAALAMGSRAHANGADARCALKGSRTVVKTASVRVFKCGETTYACLYSANRRVRLGTYSDAPGGGTSGQRAFRLAGRYVAFEDFETEFDFGVYQVVVVNLRSGRRLIRVNTGQTPQTGGLVAGIGPTTRIRLRATGQVAWIAQDTSTPAATRYEVRKGQGRSRSVLLAQGADVAPRSLGLVGDRLSWTQRGQRRHATLGPPPKQALGILGRLSGA